MKTQHLNFSAICNPTDLLKVRMQSAQNGFKTKSLSEAFISIYSKECFRGLYRVSEENLKTMGYSQYKNRLKMSKELTEESGQYYEKLFQTSKTNMS